MSSKDAQRSYFRTLLQGSVVSLGVAAATLANAQETTAQKPTATKPNLAPVRTATNPNNPAATRTASKENDVAAKAAAALNQQELKVMAVVNGDQITRTYLGQECVRRYGKDVLESLINRHLIAQECQKSGVVISQRDIDAEITHVAQKFGLTVENWINLLKEERGVSIDQYRDEIIWPTIALRKLAAERIQVTPEELQKAYETEFGARVKCRVICTSKDKHAREALALAKAQPGDFSEISKKYSEDPNIASVGGMIPPIRKHLGDPELERIAFSLKEGQVSDIIRVQSQYFILLCEGHEPPRFVDPKQMNTIKQSLADRIRDQKLRNSASELFTQLQKEAQVVNLFEKPELQATNPGVAATINGKPITTAQLSEECLRRNGRDVLEGEINRKLLTQELTKKNVAVTEQDMTEEISRAAILYGCTKSDGSADLDKWMAEVVKQDGATVDLYRRDAVWPSVALKKLCRDRVTVSQEDLQKGFESNYGPRVQVLAIVLADHKQAQRVWEMARNNPTDDYFGKLSAEYSVEPVSKGNNGKVPPIRKHGGQPIVEAEAFKLKKGDLSSLLAVGDKFIILRCLGQTKPEVAKLEEVRSELYADLLEKKLNAEMSKTFEAIRMNAQIDNFLLGTSQSGRRPSPSASTTEPATPRVGALPKK